MKSLTNKQAAHSQASLPAESAQMKYGLILADPPWRYSFSRSDSRKVENQYATMTVDEICALESMVSRLAADDAVLFMWATAPKLREALAVVAAWQFEYKTHAIWQKRKLGMGYYFRSVHELLLVATRGRPGVPLPADRLRSIFVGEQRRHSEKPEASYEIIERMYPRANKIELFARARRAGWHAWGDEVDAPRA